MLEKMQEKKKPGKAKNIFSILTIVFALGVLIFLLQTESGLKSLRHIFFHLEPVWLIWIAVGILAGWFLEAYVIHLLCRHIKKDWKFSQSFYIAMVGFFYSSITPFNAGEPMEVYNMAKMDMDTGAATSIIAVKSLVHHAVTFFYAFILVAFELNYFQMHVSNFSFITIFGLFTNSIFIFFVVLFLMNEKLTDSILLKIVRFMNKIRLRKWSGKFYDAVHGELESFHDSSKKMGKSVPLYVLSILLTVVQVTVASLISYFVYRSFSLNGEPVFTMVAADTFVVMAASFIPLPGSTGGAEGGFYLFFREFFGDNIIPAIALWRVATFYVNIIFGSIVTAWGGRYLKGITDRDKEK